MKLETRHLVLPRENGASVCLEDVVDKLAKTAAGLSVLRWGVVRASSESIVVEYAVAEGCPVSLTELERSKPTRATVSPSSGSIVFIVPTGVGAAIGGFIGDASPIARVVDYVCDGVVTHPNVVNAAGLYGGTNKTLYVDGLTLDRFLLGTTYLGLCNGVRRVGVLVDQLPETDLEVTLHAIDATRTVFGVNISSVWLSPEKLQISTRATKFGHYVGEVANARALLKGAEDLTRDGAEAIAAVTNISGITDQAIRSHYAGRGVNPVGATEALVSRYITAMTGLPCAHAPAFGDSLGKGGGRTHPRVSAELVSRSGLGSIVVGLSRAALPLSVLGMGSVNSVSAIVVPFDCAGGVPALAAMRRALPFVAVKENRCAVGLPCSDLPDTLHATVVDSYRDAIAFLAAMRAGVSFQSIFAETKPLVISNGSQ
jgi:hypothetical protein